MVDPIPPDATYFGYSDRIAARDFFQDDDARIIEGSLIVIGRLQHIAVAETISQDQCLTYRILNERVIQHHFNGTGAPAGIQLPSPAMPGTVQLYEEGIRRYVWNATSVSSDSWFFKEIADHEGNTYVIEPRNLWTLDAQYLVVYSLS